MHIIMVWFAFIYIITLFTSQLLFTSFTSQFSICIQKSDMIVKDHTITSEIARTGVAGVAGSHLSKQACKRAASLTYGAIHTLSLEI